MTRTDTQPQSAAVQAGARRAYSIAIGLAALTVLLQGVWAGLFIQEGEDYKDSWVEVHARGADIAIALTAIALVMVVWKLRERRDLLIGTAALLVALVLEAYLGGLIGDTPGVTVIHFPLALAIMGLVVWLPFRARRG